MGGHAPARGGRNDSSTSGPLHRPGDPLTVTRAADVVPKAGKVTGPNGSSVPSANRSQAVERAGGSGSGTRAVQVAGSAAGSSMPRRDCPSSSGADRRLVGPREGVPARARRVIAAGDAPDHVDGLGVLVPALDVEEDDDALVERPVGDDRAGLQVRTIGRRRQNDGGPCEEADKKDEAGVTHHELTERNDTSVGRSGFRSVPWSAYGDEPIPEPMREGSSRRGIREDEREAGLKGFEPLAYGLRVRRSTELSYKPVLALP